MKAASSLLPPEFAGAALRWEPPGMAAGAHTVHSARHLGEIEKAAQQKGHAQGHAEGYAAGMREAREQVARLQALFDHLAQPLQAVDAQVESDLVALAVDVARRLAGEALQLDAAAVAHVIHEALATLPVPARELRIHLHPQDAQALRGQLQLETEARWTLVPDSTLARGDCRLDAGNARVDARLDTRAAGLLRGLLGGDA